MWEIRETFVALITTSIPAVVPLVRRWLCCGQSEKLTTSERVEAAKRGSKSSQTPRRTSSKAVLKAQAQLEHNAAMRDRYLSGFDGQEDQEKLPYYDAAIASRSNSLASTSSRTEEMDGEEMKSGMRRDLYALTTPGQKAVPAKFQGRDEDSGPQTVRDIV